jgi:hypothetical protein
MTPPALPFACSLELAPLGSWAEYRKQNPLMQDPTTERVALVGKGPAGVTIERSASPLRPGDWVLGLVFAPGKPPPGELRHWVFQEGTSDPMYGPSRRSSWQNLYLRVDPRWVTGTEEITVAAGSFIGVDPIS